MQALTLHLLEESLTLSKDISVVTMNCVAKTEQGALLK
jgi:hypothetical protein